MIKICEVKHKCFHFHIILVSLRTILQDKLHFLPYGVHVLRLTRNRNPMLDNPMDGLCAQDLLYAIPV